MKPRVQISSRLLHVDRWASMLYAHDVSFLNTNLRNFDWSWTGIRMCSGCVRCVCWWIIYQQRRICNNRVEIFSNKLSVQSTRHSLHRKKHIAWDCKFAGNRFGVTPNITGKTPEHSVGQKMSIMRDRSQTQLKLLRERRTTIKTIYIFKDDRSWIAFHAILHCVLNVKLHFTIYFV